MNFIEETNKHARAIENWKQGHGFSDKEALQDLANIWDEFKRIPKRAVAIYGKVEHNFPDTEIGCGSCETDLLQFVYNWRDILQHEVPTIEYKGIKAAVVVENTFIESVKVDVDHPVVFDEVNSNTKFVKLKQIAKAKGIKFTRQDDKKALLKLINESK